MNDFNQLGGASRFSDPRGEYTKLAQWLQQVMETSPLEDSEDKQASRAYKEVNETQLELLLDDNYHIQFYQQLPDFIMGLLTNDPQATLRYASLLYHMVGCSECHSAYLDLYDAMRAAVQPEGMRVSLGQGTRTLYATPPRMLAHLCQTLISQAEEVLRQARRDHVDNDASARELLQLALRISSRIAQSSVRRQALQDLVRVATLFEGPTAPKQEEPGVYAYSPTFAGAGGMRRAGKRGVRSADILSRSNEQQEQPMIDLQAHSLEGNITQNGQTLELHLQDLDEALRGHHISISVLLGSLIEPVRWRGGNPLAIRSINTVDASGSLVVPLGETDLQLSNPEERNLLEAMFMLLEVRVAD
ncbi:MAG TPA: hypothetical protein VFB12_28635 [Ktedonobacteraceae bacterium]|nr:hypothetical protein [Ktedonobacteraceae bacterium]